MNTDIEKAKQIIAENIYMTLATSSADGRPWISPVFFAYDEYYNLFWVSNKDSLHSSLIRNNPKIAIVIFNSQATEGTADAVYFEAEAFELKEKDEIEHAAATLRARVTKDEFKVNTIKQVTGDATWRIYRATPFSISKLTEAEYINGQYTDKRIPIKLS
jgi:nitroimidazol reductase NimA-like FMN-containing flavoprotein (pyridoxamine 5'-phosphate oxidase superfamily)